MESRYREEDAAEIVARYGGVTPEVALRVYTSRLIGAEPSLVLHGGGNTSVKGVYQTLLGDRMECLWVKGSGSSLDRLEPRDLPALDLAYLRRLRELTTLSDEEMQNQLRTHLFDATAPNPSVEALLHAFLPHAFVDHSHADAVLALTNQVEGERWIQEALGEQVISLPYIMPGFPLAKAVAEAYEKAPGVRGIVLAKHGLFSFGATARESYEAHIALVSACESFLAERANAGRISQVPIDREQVAARLATIAPILRGAVANATGSADQPFTTFVMEHRASAEILAYCASEEAPALVSAGPLTPDHVIRTKASPLLLQNVAWDASLAARVRAEVASYRERYDAYFARCTAARQVEKSKLDSAPRVVLIEGVGIVAFGRTKKDANIAADLSVHTVRTKQASSALGKYEALGELDLFDMEYWSLEQAKLGKARPRALEGQVALITGGAGAIGRGIAEELAAAGAHVLLLDRDAEAAASAAASLQKRFGAGMAASIVADVTSEAAMRHAFEEACRIYGGVDILIPNAGVALVKPIAELESADALRLIEVNYLGVLNAIREATAVFAAQKTGGSVIINSSKNVFSPGKDFAAYSASKAAAHQLGKVAAIELAALDVRVNLINADAIFSEGGKGSGLWNEVGPSRAASRGLALSELPDFYRERNLLKARVGAHHVGRAVVFFASRQTPTTGATLPIDGGVVEAFPR